MSYAGRRYPPLGGPNMFSTVEKTPEGILQTPGGFIWNKAAECQPLAWPNV
jgi:hypothetical protein